VREEDIRPSHLLDEFFALLRRDAERLARKRPSFVAIACPFCGADESRTEFEKDGYPYVSCALCGSLYVSPRPSATDLREYADASEAVRFWSSHFYRQTAEARREKMFRPRAALVAGVIREHLDGVGRVADIGAGYGLFLEEVRALGSQGELIGVEPDDDLAAICGEKGFTVMRKWVEDIEEGEVSADVATCFEVIEHAFDPLAFLRGCCRVVRPGGLLILTTLTIDGFDLQVLWDRSRSITPPQHINFPTLRGARALVTRAGLELLSMTTPGELDLDIVRNVLRAQPGLSVPRFVRALTDADDGTRADFQSFLQRHHLSSHMRLVMRRS
jgi:SAM-dependent methyltransferase